ncbi:hypothetical protein [Actinomadura rugatobispora]|uniref:Uncharacterized protein n=1 Tax=Actinomadura rugatobispora TaxID=1994 RepID=A0ABW1AEB5_9ACTN|nr:hypothetical protein GCM10010200_033850 [Actinomadura rugatobispora]
MAEVGANPGQAVTQGNVAEELAGTFEQLVMEFQMVVSETNIRAVEAPIQRGYLAYCEANVSAMARVQTHGVTLSGNIVAAGTHVGQTDQTITGDMSATQALLRNLNYEIPRGQ